SALDFCWHWLARLLVGYQTERRDAWLGWSGWGRRWLGRWIFGMRVNDAECVFRLARREIFRRIPIQSRTPLAHFEVLAKANHLGAWMAQVPVSWIPPKAAPPDRALRRQMHAELLRLFKRPDFSAVKLIEPIGLEGSAAFRGADRYRLPKDLGDFAQHYEACFEQAVRRRMAEV